MAYFILALLAIFVIGGAGAMLFTFAYALYIKYYLGDRRKLLDIFFEL